MTTQNAARRTAGRKRTRPLRADGRATRDRIIETAGELFARHGFAETTSKAIARAAAVDVASINYHFGSRNGLYQQVLLVAHDRIVALDELEQLTGSPLPAEEKLRRLIGYFVEAALEAPGWHMRVLAREILAPTSNIEVLKRRAILPKMAVARAILAECSGLDPQDPALLRSVVSVIAPCLVLALTGQAPSPLPIRDNLAAMGRDALTDHLVTFSLAGLAAIAAGRARAAP